MDEMRLPIERPGGRSARREAGEAFILAILHDPLRVKNL
jgi:hypothetical protein